MTTTDKLCAELQARRAIGKRKYGVTLDDAGLSHKELLQHLKEELLDSVEYIQAMLDKME